MSRDIYPFSTVSSRDQVLLVACIKRWLSLVPVVLLQLQLYWYSVKCMCVLLAWRLLSFWAHVCLTNALSCSAVCTFALLSARLTSLLPHISLDTCVVRVLLNLAPDTFCWLLLDFACSSAYVDFLMCLRRYGHGGHGHGHVGHGHGYGHGGHGHGHGHGGHGHG